MLISEIITSPVISVILTLLIIFQWYKQRAKEQSVKNNLLAIRRILSNSGTSEQTDSLQKTEDTINVLDATLATLGSRSPFVRRLNEVMTIIEKRFEIQAGADLTRTSNEIEFSGK